MTSFSNIQPRMAASKSQGLVSEGMGGCYPSDHIGYGEHQPIFTWPNGARVAVQFVLNYEEVHRSKATANILGRRKYHPQWR